MPNGGYRMVEASLDALRFSHMTRMLPKSGTNIARATTRAFLTYIPQTSKPAVHSGVITGLPDAYGRGRIIGDYRRVALYGIDFLREQKKVEFAELNDAVFTGRHPAHSRRAERNSSVALAELKEMGLKYGIDMSKPATNAREAIQFTYLAYLASVKEQNGAAMSSGVVFPPSLTSM